MEIKNLTGIVLLFLFVGMLLGVGVMVIDQFGRAARTSTTVVSTGLNLSVASSVDFAQEYCTSIVSVANSTTSHDVSALTFSNADGCVIANTGIASCGATGPYCNITYKYGADTTTATAMINTNSAITPIASTWLSLLVTVVILSIIIGLVISSFGRRR